MNATESLSAQSRAEPTISVWIILSLAIERRRALAAAVGLGILIATVVIFLRGKQYESIATVMPTASTGPDSRLAGLASQFGLGDIPVGKSGGFTLSADLVMQLSASPTLLGRVLNDSVTVDGMRVAIIDVLLSEKGDGVEEARRRQEGVRALQHVVRVRRNKQSGTVSLVATTKWPSVSLALVHSLVRELNVFTFELARTQARAERQFIEGRLAEREAAVRAAEMALANFVLENRAYEGSPRRLFDYERLQRDVTLQQQVVSILAQSSEDAAIREVRDTPSLVVVESPELPVRPVARRRPLILLFGALAGLGLGIVYLVSAAVVRSLDESDDDQWRSLRQNFASLRSRGTES